MVGSLTYAYYFLCAKVSQTMAWACTSGERFYSDKEIIENALKNNSLGVDLVLTKIISTKDGSKRSLDLTDLKHLWMNIQPNNFAYMLFSSKLKQVIENHLTGEEGIVWLPVQVIGPEEVRTYYIPRFTRKLNLLDEEKSVYTTKPFSWESGKSVIIPCFAFKKIQRYAMFHSPLDFWEIPTAVYVNEDIKTAIRKARLTGIGFEDVRVSYD